MKNRKCNCKKSKYVLQWHITHLCNLRCKHCYQEEYNNHMPKEDFYNYLDKFCDYIKEKNVLPQINLTGGEPLLHPNFFEFAKEIRKRNIKLGILTNGTMIDIETAKRISDLKPIMVQISLDGIKETHDEIRGNGNFEKALIGIDNLKKFGVKVLVSFTAQKCNYKDFSELVKICKRHKVDKIWWDRIVTYSKEDTETKALSTEEFKELVEVTNKLRKHYNTFYKSFNVANDRGLQFIGSNDCGYVCGAGGNLIIFLADGSVMPCRRIPFIIGNIKDDNLENIIKSSSLMKELKEFYAPIECYTCKNIIKCKGGSRCVTYAQTGDLYRKDVNCFME